MSPGEPSLHWWRLHNQHATMHHQSSASIRVNPGNPDHHLWNNHGTWFLHYTVHPTALTKERVRSSLRTKSLDEARARRDALLGGLLKGGAA